MLKRLCALMLAVILMLAITPLDVFAGLISGDSTEGDALDFSDLIETEEEQGADVPAETALLAHWKFDELRGDIVTDSVCGRTAVLNNASFEAGISGNGVRIDPAKNGMIDFGERGITSLAEGRSKYSICIWILPSYYLGVSTTRLFTMGADSDGNALLDVNWGKNNVSSASRPGISATVRATHADAGVMKYAKYTLDESVIPNLAYMGNDTSRTFGVWQLLTVNVDLAAGIYTVYINDEQLISESFSPSVNVLTSGNAALLSDSLGYSSADVDTMAFNGVVDDFRVYDGNLSREQIAVLISENKDTTSPTADQKLVDALIERLGGAAVIYRGSSSALLNGMIVKLDPEDYSLCAVFKNRDRVYVPKAFALSYFGSVDSETDEDGYVELNGLCEKAGYGLYYSFSEKLAIITPRDVADFEADDASDGRYTNLQYRQRMAAFFENAYYPEPTTNAEQSRRVVYTSEEFGKFVYSPSICVLDGIIYASCDIMSDYTLVFRSADGGKTWEQTSKIERMKCATLFAYDGQLCLLGLYTNTTTASIGICGTRSISDDGPVWSAVSAIRCDFLEKSGHCSSTPVLFANGRVYKAFEDSNIWAAETSENGTKKAFVLSCDLNKNILNGANWIASNYVTITSDWVKEQIGTSTTAHHGTPALEGNMVQGPDGTIYNILRLNCEPANGYAVCLELSDDGRTLSYPLENKVIKFPGGENKFNIRYDETTGYYISLVNNNTAPYWPMQRNVLSLSVSKDLVNWKIVDTVLIDRTMLNFDVSMATHAFQYVDWCFDGEDIVFSVRETMGDTDYFHNGYELTFYRLSDYKSLLDTDATDGHTPEETDMYEDTGEATGIQSNTAKYFLTGGIAIASVAVVGGVWYIVRRRNRKIDRQAKNK